MGYVRSTQSPRSRLSCLGFDRKKALNQGMFDKVIRMCDDLVAELKQEQQDDNDDNESCEQQCDLADDKKKALERALTDAENAIAKAKEAIETLTDEIKALEKGIRELDESMVEAIEEHKEETNLWPLTQTRKNS